MGNQLSYPEEDLTGKVAIVTGGNTGIGYETAKALVRLGAHTFIGCRSKERAEAAIERMKTELSAAAGKKEEGGEGEESLKIEYLPLDLSSFQSTIDFVRAFKEKNLPLHLLINNAALFAIPYRETEDKFESQFQVNHLSHMLLTLELLPLLLDTASSSGDGRIVFVSSAGHTMASPFDVSKLSAVAEGEYKRLQAYNNSKLYNIMTSIALQRRLSGKNITISSLNPGFVQTEINRGFQDKAFLYGLHKVVVKVAGRTAAEGAATTLNCAINPALNSQQHFYYDSCRTKLSSVDARNERFQEELWTKSFEFLKDHLSPDTIEKYGPKDTNSAAPGEDAEVATEELKAVTQTEENTTQE